MTKSNNVLDYIANNPGCTQTNIISAFGHAFFDTTPQYGSQQKASSIIAYLRRMGFLRDVSERCLTCGAAKTRSRRNVKLYATKKGVRHLDALGVADSLHAV
jgi:hypothetical protein